MTIGRLPAFIFAATLLAGSIPGAAAYCWFDSDGYEYCDGGLSYAVRIIIGVSVSVVCIALLSLIAYRRRRAAQANLVYLQQPQGQTVAMNGNPYGPNGMPPSAPPQYPTQTYNVTTPTTATPFVQQPVSSPPQNYGPPSGGPPIMTIQK